MTDIGRIDIGVVIALEEEYEVFVNFLRSKKFIESETEYITEDLPNETYRLFTFSAGDDKNRLMAVALMNNMTPHNSYLKTEKLIRDLKPTMIVNIGIAGSMDKNVKLGSVVVASEVDWYTDKSAMRESKNRIEYEFAGSVHPTTYVLRKHIEGIFKETGSQLKKWSNECNAENYFPKNLVSDLRKGDMVDSKVKVTFGPVASGEWLVDCFTFKKGMDRKNRKFQCLEMEASGVAAACHEVYPSVPCLVIRAVSDFGDGKKNSLPNKKEIREWAMRNATYLLSEILKDENRIFNCIDIGVVKKSYYKKINLKGIEVCSNFEPRKGVGHSDAFFENFLSDKEFILEKGGVSNFICDFMSRSGGNKVLNIYGDKGVGKTEIIRSYLSHTKSKDVAYINARKLYIKYIISNKVDLITLNNAIEKEIKKLSSGDDVVVIDGIDSSWSLSEDYRRYVREIEASIKKSKIKKLIICSKTREAVNRFIIGKQGEKNCEIEYIGLEAYDMQIGNSEDVVDAFIEMDGLEDSKRCEFKNLISLYDPRYLDLSVLNIISLAVKTDGIELKDLPSAIQYYLEGKAESLPSGTLSNAELFSYFIKRQGKECDEKHFNSFLEIGGSRLIVDYLSSKHALYVLTTEKKPTKKIVEEFDTVFDDRRNSLHRSLLNKNCNTREELISGIDRFFKKMVELSFKERNLNQKHRYFKGMAHLCYLAGRIKAQGYKNKCKEFLKKALNTINIEAEKDSELYRDNEFGLLKRSIFISLSYQGDKESMRQYIDLLIENPFEDCLNRGFHLEYYGDMVHEAENAMIHQDDLGSYEKTYGRIANKIQKLIEEGAKSNLIEIEIHTLVSLVLHRQREGKLDDKVRIESKKLISSLIDADVVAYVKLVNYCRFATHVLAVKKFPFGRELDDLYSLKTELRFGWLNRDVHKKIRRTESVAEHTFGVFLIALLYLPESFGSVGNGYDKNLILRWLFLHDCGEAFLGDRFQKDLKFKDMESNWINFVRHLGVFEGVSSLGLPDDFYDRYESKSDDINIQIASEIDSLESLVQLCIYRDNISEDQFNTFKKDLSVRIKSDLVRPIKDKLLLYFEGKHSDSEYLGSWPEELINPSPNEEIDRLKIGLDNMESLHVEKFKIDS